MNRPNPKPKGSALAIPLAAILTLLAITSGSWLPSWLGKSAVMLGSVRR